MLKKNLANLITLVRLVGTVCLLFLSFPSTAFFVVYTLCGVSDALDGFVARKMQIQSRFGSTLDSIADLSFYTVMMVKLIPTLYRVLPMFVWYVLGVVLLLRIGDYGYTAIRFHRFAAMHTILNKVTGGMMFLIPFLTEQGTVFTVYIILLLGIGLAAVVQELILHSRMSPQSNETT